MDYFELFEELDDIVLINTRVELKPEYSKSILPVDDNGCVTVERAERWFRTNTQTLVLRHGDRPNVFIEDISNIEISSLVVDALRDSGVKIRLIEH
jgi:hypothetical protein